MFIYYLDSSFRQLFPLFQQFSWAKAEKLQEKKKIFVLSLKLNF